MLSLKSGMQKTELKNLHSSNSFRIHRDKTPLGLHGEEEKSNLTDRDP